AVARLGMTGSSLRAVGRRRSMSVMRHDTRVFGILLGFFLTAAVASAQEAQPEPVLQGVQQFLAQTARADGSFQPGKNPAYPGMSDSAYSDLAPTVYAVILHRTFGWKLPHEDKTKEFLLARQGRDGAFFNVAGTADPQSSQARA